MDMNFAGRKYLNEEKPSSVHLRLPRALIKIGLPSCNSTFITDTRNINIAMRHVAVSQL